MRLPQAIMFDLDGTLLDGSGHRAAIAKTSEAVAAEQPDLGVDRLVLANRRTWDEYWPQVESQWTLGTLNGVAVSEEAWRRTLRACGCLDEGLVRLAVEAYSRFERETYRPFDDARQVITWLEDRVPLALISNGAADTQREKISVIGMDTCFTAVALSGELGVAKPDKAIFRFALDQLCVEAEDAWHVGDNLATDIAGARAAGVRSVWLNRNGALRQPTEAEPDLEISVLTDLLLDAEEAEPG